MKITNKGHKYLKQVAYIAQPIFEQNKWHYELPNSSPSADRIYRGLVDMVEGIDPKMPDDLVTMSGRFVVVRLKGEDLGFSVSLEIVDPDSLIVVTGEMKKDE
jgi:hypothetical protein